MNQELWQQAQTIYERALTLKDQERSVYISEKTANNSELKLLVEGMLEAENDNGFMQSQPIVSMSENLESEQLNQFGHFKIIEKIAVGGMGRIYKAHNIQSEVAVFVALKLIRRELLSDQMLMRFDNEKSILGKLKHHHIAVLIDAGVVNETPYLATEWIDGQPINDYVQNNELNVNQILSLFLQACEAVAYAHTQLVIHRDLKPANILIDGNMQVKLLDFGIAKLIDDGAAHMTQTQVFTPDYAAPEQINGEPSTTTTDVYALGLLLFELLVGEKRFKIESNSVAEKIATITRPKTEFASDRMLANHHKQAHKVSGALDTIVNKAMHADPNRRYESVFALISDIKSFQRHLPIQAMGDSWWYRGRMFIKRNAWSSGMALLLMLSLLGGMFYSNLQKQQAIRAQHLAQDEAEKNQQMLSFFKIMLQTASPITGAGTQITVREMFEKSSENFNLQDISDDELRADIASQVAEVYGDLSANDLKNEYNREALKFYETDIKKYAIPFLTRHLSIAIAYRNQNKIEAALTGLEHAYEQVKGFKLEPKLEAQVLVNMADFLRSFDRNDEALEYLKAAEVIARSVDDPVNLGKVKYYQYLIFQYRLSPTESEQYLVEALNYFERAHKTSHPNLLGARNSMAIKLKVEGRYREAVKIYKQLHQEYSELYGFENHNHLINHADAMYYLGDFTIAISIIDHATTIIEQNDVGEGFSSMAARIIKSRSLLEVGQVDEAEELLKTAIAYFSEKLPAGHTLLFTLDTYWLDFLLKSNRVAELNLDVAELIDGVAALKNNSNDSKRRYINTQMIGATYYWTNNQPQLALSHFTAAYNIIKDITVKQEWNYWYVVASNEQLKKQLQKNHDEAMLAQALSELFVLLPENHWYHKLFQDHD